MYYTYGKLSSVIEQEESELPQNIINKYMSCIRKLLCVIWCMKNYYIVIITVIFWVYNCEFENCRYPV